MAGAGVLVSAAFIIMIVVGKPLLLKVSKQMLLLKKSASKDKLTDKTETAVPSAFETTTTEKF